jgi:hypothetical protein
VTCIHDGTPTGASEPNWRARRRALERQEPSSSRTGGEAGLFCSQCGTRLQWKCSCGVWGFVPVAANFCPSCGKPKPEWVK